LADDLYTVFFFNLHTYNKQPYFVPKISSIQFSSCNSSTFIHSIAVSSSYRHEMQFQDQRTFSEFLLHSISIVPYEMCFNDVRKTVSRVGTDRCICTHEGMIIQIIILLLIFYNQHKTNRNSSEITSHYQ